MGCVLLSIGIVFAKNLSQEDNTPLSFYTEDLTSAIDYHLKARMEGRFYEITSTRKQHAILGLK
jgi:hypothetical protein